MVMTLNKVPYLLRVYPVSPVKRDPFAKKHYKENSDDSKEKKYSSGRGEKTAFLLKEYQTTYEKPRKNL